MTELYNDKYEKWIKEGKRKSVLTIFTPTYNRAKFLPRISTILENQTSNAFVWILVNDGSNDNTDIEAGKILNTVHFPMLYISKENGHKHSCFKAALERCETEYFMCMDDDDIYSSETVEFFLREWLIIKKERNNSIGAIRVLTENENGFVSNIKIRDYDIGKKEDISTLERTYVQHIFQENCTCYDSNKLKEIDLFPEDYWLYEYHKFFLESIWQGRFARKYKCRYINKSLCRYTTDAPSSILRSVKDRQHYMDLFINMVLINNDQYDYIKKNVKGALRNVIILNLLCGFLKIGFLQLVKNINPTMLKFYLIITSPLYLMGPFVIDRRNR